MSEKRERSNTKEETVPKRETRKGEKKKEDSQPQTVK